MDDSIKWYDITHRTHYEYSTESSLCHNELHLRPRELPGQQVGLCSVLIEPKPACRFPWRDTFGNWVEFFSIEELHANLTVLSRCRVGRRVAPLPIATGMTWSDLPRWMRESTSPESLAAHEFVFDSSYCQSAQAFLDYARGVVRPGAELVESLLELNRHIFSHFQYEPDSTHVTTHPVDVLQKKRGVCQDFAHLLICLLRSLGIPARYVSGYLLTHPPPGEPKLIGADASHAWVSAYAGPSGWIDLDPTNNATPGTEHITVAWGRDYADVAPIQGVFVGGGFTSLKVSVDVSLANETGPE